jgi:predicted amidohydrolase
MKQSNREAMAQYAREAATKGAVMVVTSEFGVVGYPDIPELPSEEDEYRNRADIAPYVETVPGPSTEYFGKLAKELKIYFQFSLAEVDPKTDAYYNAAVVIDPSGRVVAKYRKMNLYQLENQFLSPGSRGATFETPFGKVGILICADVYSGQPLAQYRSEGVKVLSLSTSWAQWNTGMSTFKRAATGMSAYLLAANQPYFPDSGVINPDGSFQSHIRQTDGIAYGYLPRVSSSGAPVR